MNSRWATVAGWCVALALLLSVGGRAGAAVGVVPATPTVEEARKIVIDYMTKMAMREWVCATTMDFTAARTYTKTLVYRPGVTYFGIPYVSNVKGVEYFGEYLDANKVFWGPDVFVECPGVTCASAVKMAYRAVSPTVSFGGTPNILPHAGKGTVAVGEYKWQASTPSNKTLTKDIIEASTSNAILEAYALLQPADAIATRALTKTGVINGHARLVSSAPVVVRGEDGKIKPGESYLHVIEQTGSFDPSVTYKTTWRVNKKYTLADLLKSNYVPLTLEEFKAGKMADAQITASGLSKPEAIMASNRLAGTISSNFTIRLVTATVYYADGRVAAEMRVSPEATQCDLSETAFDRDVTKLPSGEYRFVLMARIGYGDYVCVDGRGRK